MINDIFIKSQEFYIKNGNSPTGLFISCDLLSSLIKELNKTWPQFIEYSKEELLSMKYLNAQILGLSVFRVIEDGKLEVC